MKASQLLNSPDDYKVGGFLHQVWITVLQAYIGLIQGSLFWPYVIGDLVLALHRAYIGILFKFRIKLI